MQGPRLPLKKKNKKNIYFEVLIEVGSDWGLTINFNKSAIMDFFTHRILQSSVRSRYYLGQEEGN